MEKGGMDHRNNIFSIITSTIIELTVAIHRRNTFFMVSKMIGNTVNEELDMLNVYDHNVTVVKIFLENIKNYELIHKVLFEGEEEKVCNKNGSVNIVVSKLVGRKNYSVGHPLSIVIGAYVRQPPEVNGNYRYKDLMASAFVSFGNTVEMLYNGRDNKVSYFWYNNRNGFHSYTIDLQTPRYFDILSLGSRKLPKYVKDRVEKYEKANIEMEQQVSANFLVDLYLVMRRGGIFHRGVENKLKLFYYLMPIQFILNSWDTKFQDGKGRQLIHEDFVIEEGERDMVVDVFLEVGDVNKVGVFTEKEKLLMNAHILENSVFELMKMTRKEPGQEDKEETEDEEDKEDK